MVLKALFIDNPLHPIEGLDRRWNLEVARILCDYTHESRAAGRPVTPDLWRGVGRFAAPRNDAIVDRPSHHGVAKCSSR